MRKYYLVVQENGHHHSCKSFHPKFITESKLFADNWCVKANRVLKLVVKSNNLFLKMHRELEMPIDNNWRTWMDRSYKINEIFNFYVEEVELRL